MITSPSYAPAQGQPFEVLHFEDNSADSWLVQFDIDTAAFLPAHFTVVQRLSQGIALLENRHFDVALLDLNLPDSKGLDTLVQVRRAAPDLPVVAVSGSLTPELSLELLRQGAQDSLLKHPNVSVMLANALRFAIERQHTKIELARRAKDLQASEARIRAIIDASLDAILIVDAAGIVRFANPAAEVLLGCPATQLISRPFAFPLQGEQSTEVEIRTQGHSIVAEVRVVAAEWDGERVRLASLRDITDRKRMEETMRKAEKLQALGTLAGGIAHDFNNILLAVSGNAKLALQELQQDHPAHRSVLEIAKAGSRAVALTQKILSFSRQEESKRRSLHLQPVVEDALSMLRPILPARIQIDAHFAPALPAISADPSQLHQIIVNLVTNAADAMGDQSGSLEVRSSKIVFTDQDISLRPRLSSGQYVKLIVKDNGQGMDKITLGRIFEPFFTTKAQGRGTGMGLAIVHGIMKNHHGDVTAYSELGKGTVFHLYFPVSREELVPAITSCSLAPQGHGQRILYVDDEEPLVSLIGRSLERLGYEVTGFTDPAKALDAFCHDPQSFDALVTDLSMPGMSGIELARKAMQIHPGLPVLLTSGYIRPQDHELARSVGVRELILKPDTVEELGNALHRVLEGAASIASA